jgi:ribA/ribD-fused uncharacterized protein
VQHKMDILCFHNPDEENGYLSNWYMSQFDVNGIGFSSMEQYMMYKKAVCFRDDVIAEKILETDEVGSIKELGRMVTLGLWIRCSMSIMQMKRLMR